MKTLINALHDFLKQYPPALEIYNLLEHAGDLYFIGGVLREYRDKGDIRELRDIDMIIDVTSEEYWSDFLQRYSPVKNSFGGYKILCGKFIFDVWILKETWAYRENIISCVSDEYVKYLPETVFLNLDAIIYDLKREQWYDQKYQDAMKTQMIDVVLEKNPQILLNIIRAFILKKRYAMSFSDKLIAIIEHEKNANEHFIERLMEIQKKRYKEIIVDEIELMSLINME